MKESLRTQLKKVKSEIKHYLPNNPNVWMGDGIDHINIFRSGETALGRCLNLDFARRFTNPTLGHFRSINSAWFYLRAQNRDESIRDMNGSALKKYVNTIGGAKAQIPNFQALILHIAYLRIKTNKEFTSLILATSLPFDCYQPNTNGLSTRFAHSGWFAQGHDEIRSALREDRDPDFTFAMDKPHLGENVYAGAMEILKPKHSEEEIAAAKAKVLEEKRIADAEAAEQKAKQKAAQKAEKIAAENPVQVDPAAVAAIAPQSSQYAIKNLDATETKIEAKPVLSDASDAESVAVAETAPIAEVPFAAAPVQSEMRGESTELQSEGSVAWGAKSIVPPDSALAMAYKEAVAASVQKTEADPAQVVTSVERTEGGIVVNCEEVVGESPAADESFAVNAN